MEEGKVIDPFTGTSYSIKIQCNSEEQWTKALKFMLTNLKWSLAFILIVRHLFGQSTRRPDRAAKIPLALRKCVIVNDFPKKCDICLWDLAQPNLLINCEGKVVTTQVFIRYSVTGKYTLTAVNEEGDAEGRRDAVEEGAEGQEEAPGPETDP
ncbi:hypothetical protein GQX74_006016 [Glossina fuscipes]|nr:hypothetical protein GQX74_006016 [Glossina fuscipes]